MLSKKERYLSPSDFNKLKQESFFLPFKEAARNKAYILKMCNRSEQCKRKYLSTIKNYYSKMQ